MKDPIQERMDALTSANLRLLKRVDALERRLAELEARTPGEPAFIAPAAEPVGADSPTVEPAAESVPVPPFDAERPEVHYRGETTPPQFVLPHESGTASIESKVGLNWLNRIGAITLVIGVVFFFKYAVDNEWIGPTGRILLGVIAGLALTAYGYRCWRGKQEIYAQGITAAGLGTLYLSFWAAHDLYQLVPAALAFALMAVTTALAGGFAWLYQAEALGALSYGLGAFTPILLSSGEYRPWFFTGFVGILNLSWLALARHMRWKRLEWLPVAFTAMVGSDFLDELKHEDKGPVGTLWMGFTYAAFIPSPWPVIAGATQFFCGLGGGLAWREHTLVAGLTVVTFLVLGLLVSALKKITWMPLASLAGFTMGYWILRGGVSVPTPVALLLSIASVGFVLMAGYAVRRIQLAQDFAPANLLMLIVPGVCFYLAGFEALGNDLTPWRGLFTAALAGAYAGMGIWLRPREWDSASAEVRPAMFCAGAALVLVTVAIAVQFSGFSISVLWALETAGLAWLASRFASNPLRFSTALLAIFVLGRILAFDSVALRDPQMVTVVLNMRMFTCAVSALALWVAGWWLKPNVLGVVPYLCGHAILLFGLALENWTWAMQTAPEGSRTSAISMGLTVLGAAYGLALVAAGVAWRSRLNRLLGLGLLAVVVLKLYLADVWTMQTFYRMLAFGALGALLLATSFFYSRFRAKIETWMEEDETHQH